MLGKVNRFFLFLVAPALGFLVAFSSIDTAAEMPAHSLQIPAKTTGEQVAKLQDDLDQTKKAVAEMQSAVEEISGQATKEKKEYEEQNAKVHKLLAASKSSTAKSADVLDTILVNLLGEPVGQTLGPNANVKVYSLEESGYSGYMAKVRLKNPNALKLVLANDTTRSKGEKTSHAASRMGAVLAINAGGFMTDKRGYITPLGITVVDGKIRNYSTDTRLSFVGFNNKGRLVGGRYTSQAQVTKNGILQGASFLPKLLENGRKMPIPRDWANERHPRTLIGHFDNGDILIIVIDGRGRAGSKGVTLEEAQRKLLEFHVHDAFNLDGGGSSSFYYKGRVLNHPSDGRERPVSNSIVILP